MVEISLYTILTSVMTKIPNIFSCSLLYILNKTKHNKILQKVSHPSLSSLFSDNSKMIEHLKSDSRVILRLESLGHIQKAALVYFIQSG